MNFLKKTRLLWLFLTLALARSAKACSVCAVATEEARYAYYFTTGLLTLMPLFMIGGIVYYIAKKYR